MQHSIFLEARLPTSTRCKRCDGAMLGWGRRLSISRAKQHEGAEGICEPGDHMFLGAPVYSTLPKQKHEDVKALTKSGEMCVTLGYDNIERLLK